MNIIYNPRCSASVPTQTKPAKQDLSNPTCKTKPTKSNIPNQTYQTKANLPKQTYQRKPTKPNLPNQTYQTKPTKPNLPNQTYQAKPNLTYQTYLTKLNLLVKAVNALVRSYFGNSLNSAFNRVYWMKLDTRSQIIIIIIIPIIDESQLGKPSREKSAVFFNIVQKAFDPPPFRLNIMW